MEMEKLLLYIIEVIVAEKDCTIRRTEGGVNGSQWLICLSDYCLFILDEYDLVMIRAYIEEHPLAVDDVARNRFSHLFTSTLTTIGR